MIQFPELILKGMFRFIPPPPRQKMIDTIISCDAMFVSHDKNEIIAIVSDDDDLIPAFLSASGNHCDAVVLIRKRPVGKGINDMKLIRKGLTIQQM